MKREQNNDVGALVSVPLFNYSFINAVKFLLNNFLKNSFFWLRLFVAQPYQLVLPLYTLEAVTRFFRLFVLNNH